MTICFKMNRLWNDYQGLSHSRYSDVIMSAMASQITGVSICLLDRFFSGVDQRKHQSFAWLAFVGENPPVTGGFLSQRASKAENVSIWWRYHGISGNHIETWHRFLSLMIWKESDRKNKKTSVLWTTYSQHSFELLMLINLSLTLTKHQHIPKQCIFISDMIGKSPFYRKHNPTSLANAVFIVANSVYNTIH